MFGAIVAGRPVQTNLQEVGQGKYVFELPDGAKINHIVVFLLPGASLDPSFAATVFFQWPGKDFQLLGAISNNKQSAIFRVNQTTDPGQALSPSAEPDAMVDDDIPSGASPSVILGISVEPVAQVEAQIAQMPKPQAQSTSPIPKDTKAVSDLANKIVRHAYNYLSGFANAQGMVSMTTFNDWWAKFQNKLSVNPDFLNHLD